ncbi:MAG: 1-deoxy-D-xylulose-5-phosphate reductoisomerase [Chloroflexi bacterium]|nr:1-deoxy-D-xylulose-5-phosphate reductoisomerase [Chloroflexota bacterium]
MFKKPKGLAILGSTGSIGTQTLDVVRAFPGEFKVVALAAGRNVDLLAQQAQEFSPTLVSCGEHELPVELRGKIATLEEMATHPSVDIVVVGIPGLAALSPTLAALRTGKRVALASKEVLVVAGEIAMTTARAHGATILPLDSEHNALWQCLRGEEHREVRRLVLTASGGPFRTRPAAELAQVTPEEALAHPTWRMGPKVTIDSATLMNKGFEVLEAHWLYDLPYEAISVVVHPQSIVHSLVEFVDGSQKAQLSHPDMRMPIQYALTYPQRRLNPALPLLDLTTAGALTFEPLDTARFPCFRLAREAAAQGNTYPAALNAADEVAVELFLARKVRFTDIPRLVEGALQEHKPVSHPALDDLLAADGWSRKWVRSQALVSS